MIFFTCGCGKRHKTRQLSRRQKKRRNCGNLSRIWLLARQNASRSCEISSVKGFPSLDIISKNCWVHVSFCRLFSFYYSVSQSSLEKISKLNFKSQKFQSFTVLIECLTREMWMASPGPLGWVDWPGQQRRPENRLNLWISSLQALGFDYTPT